MLERSSTASFSSPTSGDSFQGSSKKSPQPKQSYMEAFTCPKLTEAEHLCANKALALQFYITGTSIQRIEEPPLQEAFRICSPNVKVPRRKHLAGPLLKLTNGETKYRIDSSMTGSKSVVCVTSDAWTNICSDPIVNKQHGGEHFIYIVD